MDAGSIYEIYKKRFKLAFTLSFPHDYFLKKENEDWDLMISEFERLRNEIKKNEIL